MCYNKDGPGWANQQEKAKVRNRKRVGSERDRGADKAREAGEVTRVFLFSPLCLIPQR